MGVVKVYSEVLGKEVPVPEAPERIVSLSPAITEILFLLDLGERVVGVSHFCNKPEEAKRKPRLGSYFQVNYKKLDELEPDLILVTTGAQRKLALELSEKGYTVYPIPLPVSLPGIIDMVSQVGIVTGEIKRARSLARELVEGLASLKTVDSPLRVYYEIDLGGPVSIGSHNYIDDGLSRIGLANIFSDVRQPWIINPDPEEIVSRDPQIILYEKAPYKTYSHDKIIGSMKDRGLEETTALSRGNIVFLEPDSLAHYGPSIISQLDKLVSMVRGMVSP